MPDEYPYEGTTFGDYQLIRGLGRGGFADVYLGTDIALGKNVAIKVLNTRFPRQEQIDKFKREARVVASLEHRSIIEVYRYGVEGNVPFVVMKYAPNGSVRNKHPRGAILKIETIMTYIRQLVEALQYAHNRGLIHRDIKPENMLFGSFEEILLSDFGIAILTDSRRVDPQEIEGTLSYMAPEQFEAKAVRQSDQYSLGIVVYEWLTGEVPFRVKTIYDAAVQHKSSPVPAMNRSGVIVPHEIEAVILKALAKNPQERFNSITDFAKALEEVLHRSSVTPTIGARLWTYRENEADVLTVAWSFDGLRIVTGNRNGTDRIIDSLTGQTLHVHFLEQAPVRYDDHYPWVDIKVSDFSESSPFKEDFLVPVKNASYANVAVSNGFDESASLAITGLSKSIHQRWKVPTDLKYPYHDQGVRIIWDVDCKKYLAYYKYSTGKYDQKGAYSFIPGNEVLALTVFLFFPDVPGHKPLYKTPGDWINQAFVNIETNTAFAWSCLTEVAAIASKKEGLLIIDLSNNQIYRQTGEESINALACSPQDRLLASGTDSGQITIWTVNGTELLSIRVTSNPISAIAWKPDGTQIAIAYGCEVSVYQVK